MLLLGRLRVLPQPLRSTSSVGSPINQAVISELALRSESLVPAGYVDIPETGEEVFVIEGSFADELGEHRAWSWSRDVVQAYFGVPYSLSYRFLRRFSTGPQDVGGVPVRMHGHCHFCTVKVRGPCVCSYVAAHQTFAEEMLATGRA